ncbi:hypothetical protein Lbru_0228 [Legionella brunensis]|uniref:Uncharacterized protein n=1 Tax=Legionella brunensis TaxID=29422 RepID=A0A0W0SUD5_9GAMM|nr:hypothetical protein Lbru_0228 [Legionella brunensis]
MKGLSLNNTKYFMAVEVFGKSVFLADSRSKKGKLVIVTAKKCYLKSPAAFIYF